MGRIIVNYSYSDLSRMKTIDIIYDDFNWQYRSLRFITSGFSNIKSISYKEDNASKHFKIFKLLEFEE